MTSYMILLGLPGKLNPGKFLKMKQLKTIRVSIGTEGMRANLAVRLRINVQDIKYAIQPNLVLKVYGQIELVVHLLPLDWC